jgi:hypothetical protein
MSIGITTENQSAGIPIFFPNGRSTGCHFMRFPVIFNAFVFSGIEFHFVILNRLKDWIS